MQLFFKSLLVTACLLASVTLGQQAAGDDARGPLRVHPTNPRYFSDGTQNPDGSFRAIYLTGAHTWNNLVDIGSGAPPQASDFNAYLDFLVRHDHNFIRMWAWDSTTWDSKSSRQWTEFEGVLNSAPQPWLRSGVEVALDGKPKFDLEEFDPEYFERLRARVKAAGERGIYVSVMLFEGWGLMHGNKGSAAPAGWVWRSHPFHPSNNVNGINSDTAAEAVTGPVHRLGNEAANAVQAAYIRKVVDTVNEFDNVLFEVINEGGEQKWDWWVAKTIQDYERTKPKQHAVGITGHGAERVASMLASPAEWVSPGRNDGYADAPPAWNENKVSLLDTDHIWGIGGSATWVWKSFLRGHNPLFMDPYENHVLGKGRTDQWDGIRQALGATNKLAKRMDLARMTPSPEISSTKYCLAAPGQEYLVYQSETGEFSVNLSAENYAFEWIVPTNGSIASSGSIRAAGGNQTFTAPSTGPAVLHLTVARILPGADAETPGKRVETLKIEKGDLSVLFRDNSQSPKILSGADSLFHSSTPDFDTFDPDDLASSAGLNFEHVISGHPSPHNSFTPRSGTYDLFKLDDGASAKLVRKAEDDPWALASTLTYTVNAPNAIDFEFECQAQNKELFGKDRYAVLFFANYMNDVADVPIHFRGIAAPGRAEEWIRGDAPPGHADYNEGGTYRSLFAQDLPYDADHNFKLNLWSYNYPRFTKPFYYGRAAHGMVLILMFDRMYSAQDEIRFSIFKFKVPRVPRPAWDFEYVIHNVEEGRPYGFKGRLVWKRFVSPEDCQDEFDRWHAALPARKE